MKKMTRRGFIGLAASAGAALTVGCDSQDGCGKGAGDALSLDAGSQCQAPDDLPVMAETEVLVVGGGPSGLAAALAAAKAGADTMLIDRYGFYGGVITQAIMGSITWYRYAETVDAGGVCAEIEAKAKAMGGSINLLEVMEEPTLQALMKALAEEAGLVVDGKPTYEILRSELFKIVADTMVLEAGVKPLLHCWVVGALMEGETITGVITESKSGRQVVRAKRVIDATGDADVAAFCGAPFNKAAKEDLMEVTTNFSCSNVDRRDPRRRRHPRLPGRLHGDGGRPLPQRDPPVWRRFHRRVGPHHSRDGRAPPGPHGHGRPPQAGPRLREGRAQHDRRLPRVP
jgi:hypothetical protein